ncbi:MAG TPA: DNA methyltransferase, partial [Myxococcales bacterium]|nr:DNA methyltransferase [Myxococcales bacterium]
ISSSFRVLHYLDLHRTSPFESEVIAYPAIFTIARGRQDEVRVARLETASEEECAAVAGDLEGRGTRHPTWFEGDAPWVLGSPGHLKVLRDLERRFEPLEADGKTSVRIGVATGADEAFIVGEDAPIEPDRLVPLVMREDIERGEVRDGGRRVINTFGDDGSVIDLHAYPRLKRYLETRAPLIRRRHVARKNPSSWFRTIDRVYPELVPLPKLLIPDIAGSNGVVLERGRYHPHHNLYFVISSSWDMEVLGGLLSSKVALFFVWSYAVKMRGRYLRFQAQYLRRIRVPPPGAVPEDLARDIRGAFRARDFRRLDELALAAYGLEALPAFDFVDTRK